MLLSAFATTIVAAAVSTLPAPPNVPVAPGSHYGVPIEPVPVTSNAEFDCAVRASAYNFAQKLQGWRGADAMADIHDGLELSTRCSKAFDRKAADSLKTAEHRVHVPAGATVVYVDPDVNVRATGVANDETKPFGSIHAAVASLRGL